MSIKGPIKKPKATSFVVKVQVPLDSGRSSLLAVYNKVKLGIFPKANVRKGPIFKYYLPTGPEDVI